MNSEICKHGINIHVMECQFCNSSYYFKETTVITCKHGRDLQYYCWECEQWKDRICWWFIGMVCGLIITVLLYKYFGI